MARAPQSLAEVPFLRHDAMALLALCPDAEGRRRDEPDDDFAGYGYGIVHDLVLESADGSQRVVPSALVLALHCTDEPSTLEEIELELDVVDPEGGEALTVLAPLGAFLRAHLPRLPDQPDDVVLALCNPRALDVPRLAALGQRRLHFAHGDVLSWLVLHDDDDGMEFRLQAETWHQR